MTTKYYMSRPKDYKEPSTFPQFEVLHIISGMGTVAPNTGTRYSFTDEETAKKYIRSQRKRSFTGDIQLLRMDRKNQGVVLQEFKYIPRKKKQD